MVFFLVAGLWAISFEIMRSSRYPVFAKKRSVIGLTGGIGGVVAVLCGWLSFFMSQSTVWLIWGIFVFIVNILWILYLRATKP